MIDFADFLLAGRSAGWSARTVVQYRWHLERFRAWLVDHHVEDAAGITRRLLREWSAGLRDGWSPSTCKLAITAVRSWLRWCQAEGLAVPDPAALRTPAVPAGVQRTLSVDEVSRLLAVAAELAGSGVSAVEAAAVALRNVALVSLLYDSLLRAAEICALDAADVDLSAGVLVVRRGKGGKGRRALFGESTAARLGAWLALRPAGCPALFVAVGAGRSGARLTPRGLRIIVKRLGERAGVPGVSPHAFRRGGATEASLNGMPDRILQEVGGWANLAMVERYTRALGVSPRVADAFRRFGPLSNGGKGER